MLIAALNDVSTGFKRPTSSFKSILNTGVYLVQFSHFPIIILKFKTFTSGNSYGQTLPSAASYKYLNSTLNFETHFHKAFKKEASRVNLLRKVRSSITCAAAESIYGATVMPVFTTVI